MNQELYIKTLQPIFTSSNLVIYKPDENGIMLADWSGFLKAARIKEDCLAILDSLEHYPSVKILNSNQKVPGHYAGAVDWLGKVWFPQIYERGTRFFAWVYSSEFYSQMATDQVINDISDVKVRTFYRLDDAYLWLQNS